MPILIFTVLLSILIFVHELGHFLAAKKAGVKVEEFGFGYPPRLLTMFTWRGTRFTINAIPFGGFVRLMGEEGPEEESGSSEKSKKNSGQFYQAKLWQKLFIVISGPLMNIIFGVVAFAVVFSTQGIPTAIDEARIGYVAPDSPAKESGLRPDYKIIGFTHREGGPEIAVIGEQREIIPARTVDEVISYVSEHRGETVTIITSGPCQGLECGEMAGYHDVYIRTAEETPEGEGAIGVAFESFVFAFYPSWEMPFRGTWFGLQQAAALSVEIVFALRNLFTEIVIGARVPEGIAGPIGIADQARSGGLVDTLPAAISFAGILSINLAVFNLLPIVPLDGGQIVLLSLERIFNKNKWTNQIRNYFAYAGYAVIGVLMVVVTLRDVLRLLQ